MIPQDTTRNPIEPNQMKETNKRVYDQTNKATNKQRTNVKAELQERIQGGCITNLNTNTN